MADSVLAQTFASLPVNWLISLWFFALGACIGSFLNVVIYRMPTGQSIVTPRSFCPACEHLIRSRDNIPVVSWLLLRARCRDCGGRIAARYPLVELSTGLLFMGFSHLDLAHVFATGDWPVDRASTAAVDGWMWFTLHVCAATGSVVVALMDHDRVRIPARLATTLIGVTTVVAGILASRGLGNPISNGVEFGLSFVAPATTACFAAGLSGAACWLVSPDRGAGSGWHAAMTVGALCGLCLNWFAVVAAVLAASLISFAALAISWRWHSWKCVRWSWIFFVASIAILFFVPNARV